jgi:hypothetical protein
MRDNYKVATTSVTQLSAANSQLKCSHTPSSYFSMLEDMTNLPFHIIQLTILQLWSAVSTTSISGYGHDILDVGANELFTALSSQLIKAGIMIHRALVEYYCKLVVEVY